MKVNMDLEIAQAMALSVLDDLLPAVDRIAIAGSIRRMKPQVGDIEILCIPKYKEVKDLFGTINLESKLPDLLEYLTAIRSWKRIQGGVLYCQYHLLGEINLDLFITTPEKWGLSLVLRTGR